MIGNYENNNTVLRQHMRRAKQIGRDAGRVVGKIIKEHMDKLPTVLHVHELEYVYSGKSREENAGRKLKSYFYSKVAMNRFIKANHIRKYSTRKVICIRHKGRTYRIASEDMIVVHTAKAVASVASISNIKRGKK